MTTTDIEMLRADLANYETRIAIVQAKLADALAHNEDTDYYRMVLAQLERGKGIVATRIANEEHAQQKAS